MFQDSFNHNRQQAAAEDRLAIGLQLRLNLPKFPPQLQAAQLLSICLCRMLSALNPSQPPAQNTRHSQLQILLCCLYPPAVHWYYSVTDLKRDFGEITDYQVRHTPLQVNSHLIEMCAFSAQRLGVYCCVPQPWLLFHIGLVQHQISHFLLPACLPAMSGS
jgi:hypothetical protein